MYRPDPPPRFTGFSPGRLTTREREWEAAHLAWDDFVHRPAAVYVLSEPDPPPEPVKAATNHVPDWRESQEILRSLLSEGKLRTSR